MNISFRQMQQMTAIANQALVSLTTLLRKKKAFDKDDYIWSTITAEASDTARYALQGTSIPEYNELNDLFFDEYLDYKTAKVSFKNLPYFNSFNNGRDMDEMHYGELLLVNQTKVSEAFNWPLR